MSSFVLKTSLLRSPLEKFNLEIGGDFEKIYEI